MSERSPSPRTRIAAASLILASALVLAACGEKPAEPATPATTDAPAPAAPAAPAAVEAPPAPTKMPEPAPGTDAVVVQDLSGPTVAAKGFDAKAFAGRYAGGGVALEITSDGLFAYSDANAAFEGTWSAAPGGRRVVLDPDSKSETDRQVEVIGSDTLVLVGAGTTLKRVAE